MLPIVWRVLLRACPPALRRKYGAEMEEVFRHCISTERRRRNRAGRVVACLRGLADIVVFSAKARWYGWTSMREEAWHDTRTRRPLVILRDFRGTLRLMRRQPALTAAIVLMLALGIGATTAIFSVVHGVLLKPLPFPEPDRLVQVWGSSPNRGWNIITLTEANLWDLHERNRTLAEFGAFHGASFTLTGLELPERVTGGQVSVGFFKSLGVQCVAGRLFETGEDNPGRAGLALLSHVFWTRHFGRDTSIVGRALTLDGRAYTIVGILPAGSPWLDAADVFVPLVRRANADRGSFEYIGIGRLKPGITLDAALADLRRVARDLETMYPEDNKGLGVVLQPSREWIASDDLRRALWILLGSVGLLLLIACVNVTNLLLARASTRARDYAVRTALGASRADLIRERLTESLLYGAAGAVLGCVIAQWMIGVLKSMSPDGIPRLSEVTLNGSVAAFAAAAALAVGLFTGLVPALSAPQSNVVSALRQSARGTAGDRGQRRLRSLFVGAEIGLSVILLVGAALLVRSLLGVLSVDRGFQTENRLLLTISIPRSYGKERLQQIVKDLIDGIGSSPDVVSVAAVSGQPLGPGSTGLGIAAADQPDHPGAGVPWATWRIVTKDYFRTMGLPLIAGRVFTDDDQIEKPWRAVVSKRVADLLWPGQNPIGRTAILWKGQSNVRGEVIGVVGDMRERGLESDPTLAVYFPAGGTATTSLQLVTHTRGRPEAALPAIRTVVGNIDRNLPVSDVRTLDEVVTASLGTRRLTMLLIAAFAGLALVLALAGVYGVLEYSVARRSSEIGVRIALGARHRSVLRLVVVQGMRPVIAGAAVGLVAAYWLSQLMSSLLFGVEPHDPPTYAAVAAVLIGVAVVACYVPARRVLRVDPAVALRAE